MVSPEDSFLNMTRIKGVGLNQQRYDMGFPEDELKRPELTPQHLARIQSDFDFVMISEKIDESLVLLANYLCWPLEAMAYFKQNARKDDAKVTTNKLV